MTWTSVKQFLSVAWTRKIESGCKVPRIGAK